VYSRDQICGLNFYNLHRSFLAVELVVGPHAIRIFGRETASCLRVPTEQTHTGSPARQAFDCSATAVHIEAAPLARVCLGQHEEVLEKFVLASAVSALPIDERKFGNSNVGFEIVAPLRRVTGSERQPLDDFARLQGGRKTNPRKSIINTLRGEISQNVVCDQRRELDYPTQYKRS
jgi:hypothetical protein